MGVICFVLLIIVYCDNFIFIFRVYIIIKDFWSRCFCGKIVINIFYESLEIFIINYQFIDLKFRNIDYQLSVF